MKLQKRISLTLLACAVAAGILAFHADSGTAQKLLWGLAAFFLLSSASPVVRRRESEVDKEGGEEECEGDDIETEEDEMPFIDFPPSMTTAEKDINPRDVYFACEIPHKSLYIYVHYVEGEAVEAYSHTFMRTAQRILPNELDDCLQTFNRARKATQHGDIDDAHYITADGFALVRQRYTESQKKQGRRNHTILSILAQPSNESVQVGATTVHPCQFREEATAEVADIALRADE